MYRINTENGGFTPDKSRKPTFDVNPTYLIVEEVSKTIEIINSRIYLYISLVSQENY